MFDLTDLDKETGTPSADFMDALKQRAQNCVSHMEETGLALAAAQARRIRHCLWENQHYSERAWDTNQVAAFPFNGSSDIRLRMADYIVNTRVAECFNAQARARIQFGGAMPENTRDAQWCATNWKDIIRRKMPLEWVTQNLLLCNYMFGGGRGVAGLWTGWRQEVELRSHRLTLDQVGAIWMAYAVETEGMEATEAMMGFEMAEEKDLIAILLETKLCRTRVEAKDAALDLLESMVCEVSEPVVVVARPEMKALALGDELWLPPDALVSDLEGSDEFHITSWHDAADVKATSKRDRWNKPFAKALGEAMENGQGAKESIFPLYEYEAGSDQLISGAETRRMMKRVQVVRSYFKAVDDDGVVGRYCVIWSGSADGLSARGARLAKTSHGGWPVQLYNSEVVGPYALDSRGVPQLAAGIQAHGKMCHETVANISMMQLPPIVTKGMRHSGSIVFEPLGEIALNATGSIDFMKTPQVPYTTVRYMEALDQYRDLYFGLPNEKLPKQTQENAQALRVALYLTQSAVTVERLCTEDIAHRSDEDLPEGLRGGQMLPVQIKCDPREWNAAFVQDMAKTLKELILPMDQKGVVRTSRMVESLVLSLLPDHADALQVDENAAEEESIKDEQDNYLLIRAGIRPTVPEEVGSYDFAGRMGFYEQMQQVNPAVFEDLSPDKRQLLEEHLKALNMGVMQQENVQIGRTGVKEQVGAMGAV